MTTTLARHTPLVCRCTTYATLFISTLLAALRLYTAISQESHRRTNVDQGVYCPPSNLSTTYACCPLLPTIYSIHCSLLVAPPSDPYHLLSRALLSHATHIHMPRQPSAQDLQLAAQFCPVVVFDSKEQIRPMRMQEYVEQCSVHDLRTDAVLQESTQPGIDVQLAHRSDVYLHLNHASWRRMDADDVQDVPFYVKVDRDVVHHGRVCLCITMRILLCLRSMS